MRITGGTAKGRKILGPKRTSDRIRPTSDRVREALFSILGERIRGSRVLDLFAGTGSLGLESLSRGATSAVFVDQSPQALEMIRASLHLCFHPDQAELFRLDLARSTGFTALAKRLGPGRQFDLVFLDPPYEKKLAEQALTMVETTGLAARGGVVIAEERWRVVLPENAGGLHLYLHRRYGETGIWLYTTENSSL